MVIFKGILLIFIEIVFSDTELSKNETVLVFDIDPINASEIDTSSFPLNSTQLYLNGTESTISTQINANGTESTTVITTVKPNSPVAEFTEVKQSCECDLTKDICDINCCCDRDCPKYAIDAFSFCQNFTRKDPKSHYCSSLTSSVHLLCIEYDNLKSIKHYRSTTSVFKEASLSVNRISISPFNWLQSQRFNNQDESAGFKMGSFINVQLELQNIVKWSFPKSTITKFCDGSIPLKYLQDTSTSCNRQSLESFTSLEKGFLSANFYYKNIWIRSHLKNSSKFCDILLKEPCLPIELSSNYSYRNLNGKLETHPLDPDNIPTVFLNNSTQLYENVVLKVKYEIRHAGTDGIKSVSVHFVLGSVNGLLTFTQEFHIQFLLHNETNDFGLKRGGNPGYQIGLPIIIGESVDKSKNNSDIDLLDSISNISGLTSFKPGLFCLNSLNSERQTVKFGFNINVGCYLPIKELKTNDSINACQTLQDTVQLILLGPKNYDNVGKFGNPDAKKLNDWLFIEKSETLEHSSNTKTEDCTISTALHISVAHTMTGLVNSPHIMILTFHTKFIKTKVTLGKLSGLDLRTTVSFEDVSPAIAFTFGEHPRVKIHLPETFFYPFQMNIGSRNLNFPSHLFLITQISLWVSIHKN